MKQRFNPAGCGLLGTVLFGILFWTGIYYLIAHLC